jgi:hypothetical protein
MAYHLRTWQNAIGFRSNTHYTCVNFLMTAKLYAETCVCVCTYELCNVWKCVCVGIVMCGCFGNCVLVLVICALVFTVEVHEPVHRNTIMKVTKKMQLYRLIYYS